MQEGGSELLNLVAQFTGGRSGRDYVVVNYGLAALFWLAMLMGARGRRREATPPGESWLIWAFAFALAREVFMIFMVGVQAFRWADAQSMLTVLPPLEHAMRDAVQIFVAGAMTRYLTRDVRWSQRYLALGIAAIALVYLSTFWWWAEYVRTHPNPHFDATWCDWVFRLTVSIALLIPVIKLARTRTSGIRNLTMAALVLMILYQSLKLVDMAWGGAHEEVLSPLRRLLYLLGLGVLTYAYLRELTRQRQRTQASLTQRSHDLEAKVVASSRALAQEQERTHATLRSVGEAVMTCDAQGRITHLNPAAEALTGWRSEDAAYVPIDNVIRLYDSKSRMVVENTAQQALRNRAIAAAGDRYYLRGDGAEYWLDESATPIFEANGTVGGVILVLRDMSEARQFATRMQHQAQHDFLTGLPNKLLLHDRIGQTIAQAERTQAPFALLFLDLDRFKYINESLGHGIGDKLLKQVSARLAGVIRATDTACRQGGDEFIVLLPQIDNTEAAAVVADKVLASIKEPYSIDEHELHITLSIGISVYPTDGTEIDTLIRSADIAMYHAKEAGRNNHQFFTREMSARTAQRANLESGLRRALRNNEFKLHYQPKVSLANGETIGTEALIRWVHPEHGMVSPAQFIPIAEDSGLIVPIGEWVLREACRQNELWRRSGAPAMPVAVNVSAAQFAQRNFLDVIKDALKQSGLPPHLLELELTESIIMRNAESTVAVLVAIKEMGIRVAIDDFGTGYSSLSYLKRFPIDTLKIDQSFVSALPGDADQAAITTAVIAMAKSLKRSVTAEGVETREQLDFLTAQGCDDVQGYLLSKPIPAEQIPAFCALPPAFRDALVPA